MLSIMLSTLLSIRDPLNVTSWTRAKRLEVVLSTFLLQCDSQVTIRNAWKRQDGCLEPVRLGGYTTRRCRSRGEEAEPSWAQERLDDEPLLIPGVGRSDLGSARAFWELEALAEGQWATPMAIKLFAMAAQCAERATPLSPL
jgi:hypothetical protein